MLGNGVENNLITVEVTLRDKWNTKAIVAVIDSASTKSCISHQFLKDNKMEGGIQPTQVRLIIADGSQNRSIIGQTNLDMELANGTIIQGHEFIIIHDLPVNVLLGLDCMAKIGPVTINAQEKSVRDIFDTTLINTGSTCDSAALEQMEIIDTTTSGSVESIPEAIFKGTILEIEERQSVIDLLNEYRDIMAMTTKDAVCSEYQATIPVLEGSKPYVRIKPYPIPIHFRERVDKVIKKWEADGIIEKCQSPYNSPIVCVEKKKKEGETEAAVRVCIDYRGLNSIIAPDPFVPARLNDLFLETENHKYRSSFDLPSAYLQVEIKPEDRHKTAFIIGNSQFQFTKMPFGLSVSGTAFQRVMGLVLQPLDWKTTKGYVDDVVILNKTFTGHLNSIRAFFDQIRRYGLKLSYEKMNIAQESILFVGLELSAEGFKINRKKTDGINQIRELQNKKDVRSFLGLINFFRGFIPCCSERTIHLSSSIQDNGKFTYTKEMKKEVEDIKRIMNMEPILAYPDISSDAAPFEVYTDASEHSSAYTVIQDQKGRRRIMDGGAKFTKTQRNYCIFKKEFFAIKNALKQQRHILLGRRFILYTDSQAVFDCLRPKVKESNEINEFPSPVIARWAMFILSFDFELKKIKSEENVIADCLSRLKLQETLDDDEMGTTLVQCECDEKLESCGGMYGDHRFEGKVRMDNILEIAHDKNGHVGFDKTLQAFREMIKVPGDRNLVKRWIESCQFCQQYKHPTAKGWIGQITSRKRAERPLQRIQADLHVMNYKSLQGYKYILGLVCEFSWYARFYPLKSKNSAATISKVIEFLSHEGASVEVIKTDCGGEFFGAFEKELNELGVTVVRATPYHKTKNCQVERSFGILKNILNAVIFENGSSSWVSALAEANQLYNAIPQSTTKVSPYEIVYGYPCRKGQRYMNKYSRNELMDMVNQRWSEWSKTNHRAPEVKLEVGDMVLLKRPPKARNDCGSKYGKKFSGPWEVISMVNESTYEISSEGRTVKANIRQLRRYYPRADRSFVARIDPCKIIDQNRQNSLENNEDSEVDSDVDSDDEEESVESVKRGVDDLVSTKVEIDQPLNQESIHQPLGESHEYKKEIKLPKLEDKFEDDTLGGITEINSRHITDENERSVVPEGENESNGPDLFSSIDTDELFKMMEETNKSINLTKMESEAMDLEYESIMEQLKKQGPRPKPRIIEQIRDSSTPIRPELRPQTNKSVSWSPCVKETETGEVLRTQATTENPPSTLTIPNSMATRTNRVRKPTIKLNIDPSKKSYETPK